MEVMEVMVTTTRREALAVAATAGAAVPLSGCGEGQTEVDSSDPVRIPAGTVPEGGGIVQGGVVVTQPGAGEYKAFDARCPHQGCAVNEVTPRAIICPCHGSEFDPESGDMTQGPATEGLTERDVAVDGDDLVVS